MLGGIEMGEKLTPGRGKQTPKMRKRKKNTSTASLMACR
jgi:hypothetical protein